ncbi:MAG: response regulator transcription factor [Bacteroidales bacterium]
MKVETENDITLTKREFEMLKLIAEGYSTKDLALKFDIKLTTVIFHRNNLREKFNARNCPEMVSKAYKAKIL